MKIDLIYLRRYVAIIFLVFIASCSSEMELEVPEDIASLDNLAVYSGETEPLQSVSFEREARFGDTDDIFIGAMSGMSVGDDGTLYLADRTEALVHVYNADGGYRFAIGGKGEGPGEFLSTSEVTFYESELYVLDVQQQRLSIFDTESGDYLRSYPMGSGSDDISGFPISAKPLSGDQFFVLHNSLQSENEQYFRSYTPRIVDREGNTLDSEFIDFPPSEMLLLQSDNMVSIRSLPFMGEVHIAFNRNEEVVTGFSDRFLFHVISLEGDTLRSIYHSKTLPSFNLSDVLEDIEDETVRQEISALEVPETKPAFESLYVDDENRLWVSSPTDDTEINEWWVLAENGEKLAEFTRNSSDRIRFVKHSSVYFQETDEETGVEEIVKYSFTLEG